MATENEKQPDFRKRGRSARNKGVRGEREVAVAFEAVGGHVSNLEYAGDQIIYLGKHGFHIEAKRQERLDLMRWVKQAEAEAAPAHVPLVVFRQSHEKWRVVLSLEDFLRLMT